MLIFHMLPFFSASESFRSSAFTLLFADRVSVASSCSIIYLVLKTLSP